MKWWSAAVFVFVFVAACGAPDARKVPAATPSTGAGAGSGSGSENNAIPLALAASSPCSSPMRDAELCACLLGEVEGDPTQPEDEEGAEVTAVEGSSQATCDSIKTAGPVQLWRVTAEGDTDSMHGFWLVARSGQKAKALATVRADIGTMRKSYRELEVVTMTEGKTSRGSFLRLDVKVTHYEEFAGDADTTQTTQTTLCPLWGEGPHCSVQLDSAEKHTRALLSSDEAEIEAFNKLEANQTRHYQLGVSVDEHGRVSIRAGASPAPAKWHKYLGTYTLN